MNFYTDDCMTGADVRAKAAKAHAWRMEMRKPQAVEALTPAMPAVTPPPPVPLADSSDHVEAPPAVADIVSIRHAIDAVAEHFEISRHRLLQQGRLQDLAHKRHLAMYVANKYMNGSLKAIGRAMKGRDHTTVLHGIRKIAARLEAGDTKLEALIKKIVERSRQGPPFRLCADPAPDPNAATRRSRGWSEEQDALLRQMRSEGVKSKEAAHRLDRSTSSVKCRAVRLGCPFGGGKPA